MGHFSESRGFSSEVQNLVHQLVPLTRLLWQLTKIKMLPTPAKFHYIFNLRDLSRIWQGMLNTTTEVVTSVQVTRFFWSNLSVLLALSWPFKYQKFKKICIYLKVLLGLWKHECKRVIADRFTLPEDVEWFDQSIAKLVGEKLGEENQKIVACGLDRYFVDFLRDAPEDTGIDPRQLSQTL